MDLHVLLLIQEALRLLELVDDRRDVALAELQLVQHAPETLADAGLFAQRLRRRLAQLADRLRHLLAFLRELAQLLERLEDRAIAGWDRLRGFVLRVVVGVLILELPLAQL